MPMWKKNKSLKRYDFSEEQLEEKRKKIDEMDFEKSDFFAMFLAAIITFLPPILLIVGLFYALARWMIS